MTPRKLKSPATLSAALSRDRRSKKKIVFTNGCFDILHAGHVRYLSKAKSLGDKLVLALNTDESVRGLKGPGRPVNHELDRAEVVAGLESVDYVIFFGDPTPARLIRLVRPDVLVKGGDWKKKDIVGAPFVESYGGKVRTIEFLKGRSTTKVIEKIKSAKS